MCVCVCVMALQTYRIISLLLLISVSLILLMLSWELLTISIRRTSFSREHRHRNKASLFIRDSKFWDKNGNSTLPPREVTATQKAKVADFSKANPVETLKTDQKTNASTHTSVAETPMPVLSEKSFDKLPQWDFDDVYNQDAPPRHTTCARSLQNSEDESFRESFLPNIRLFLHKDNINMSEWNRLSHYTNPFGFMGFEYDDVMPSVKLIPKPKEPLLLPKPGGDGCVRCAVVGTAGILNGSKMGKEIDAHDYIFRMNGAIIKGFEEDVGNRTSVYVHTAHSITMSPYLFKKFGYTTVPTDEGIKYVMIPEGLRDFRWLEGLLKGKRVSRGQYHNRPRKYYGGQYNETRFYVLHQDFLRYVQDRFLKSPRLNSSVWKSVRPTNGAFTVFLALHTCDIVSAYGFMTEDYEKYSNYYFEKDNKTDVIFYVNHDYILEKDTWKKLHNSKIITLYQRTDSQSGTEKPEED